VSSSVTYSAALDMRRETVLFVSGLLHAERRRRGTRKGRRALGCFAQAVLVLRWFIDGTRIRQLAADNGISVKTVYRYLHEGIDLLAAHAPDLRHALTAAAAAGLSHVNLDGVVIRTDRVKTPGPNGADLWWSGKHKHHGGNIQVISAPDGWPLWTSPVRPGREHDMTCARTHGVIDVLTHARGDLTGLADLGYEGAADVLRVPIKKIKGRKLTDDQTTYNKLLRGVRGIGERANALLIMRFKALRRISLDPWRIGAITAAALVLLHHENDRTI
jgi:DDE superfamily endonuclease